MSERSRIIVTNLLKIMGILLFILYIIFQLYSMLFVPYRTEAVTPVTYEQMLTEKAIVVRDESYIESSATGIVVPIVKDGTRVAKGVQVAHVFADAGQAQTYSDIQALKAEITRYQTLSSKVSVGSLDVSMLDKEVYKSVNDYVSAVQSGNYGKLRSIANSFADSNSTREMAVGGTISLAEKIENLSGKVQTLEAQLGKYDSITTPKAGYFISTVDGYENSLAYASVDKLTYQDVKDALGKEPKHPEKVIGKIVSEFAWYVVATVDSTKLPEFSRGDAVTIRFESAPMEHTTLKIEALHGSTPEEQVMILRGTDMNEEIANLRMEEIHVVRRTYTGLRVNNAAIYGIGDEKHVYVYQNKLKIKRNISILHSDKDYSIVSTKHEKNELLPYEEVIIEGKDVDDERSE